MGRRRAARITLALSVLALSGCASSYSLEESYRVPLTDPMTGILQKMKGQNAKVAFGMLNYPDSQMMLGDRKAYIWMNGNDCRIRLFVDQQDTITNGDWQGSVMGCSRYIEMYRRLY